jgi:hypothetical protein
MAIATNTTLGEIQLAGDLAGSNNGLAPALSPTGVMAGSYTLPSFTVDAKGRITAASNVSSEALANFIPDATETVKGKVQVGTGLTASAGVLSAALATNVSRGTVRIDTSNGLQINNGVLSFDSAALALATTTTPGVVRIGSGLTVSAGTVSATAIPVATTLNLGTVQIGANINVSNGVISIPNATTTTRGAIRIGGTGLVVNDGVLSLDVSTALATPTTAGFVKLGSNIINNNGVITVNFGVASASQLGAIRVGPGLTIDSNGILENTLATNPPVATDTTLGLVRIGANINVSSGIISIPTATTSTAGILRVGTVGLEASSGVIEARRATNTVFGVVRSGDTNNITITNGEITLSNNIPRKNTVNTYTRAQVSQLVDLGNRSGTVTLDLHAGNVQRMRLTGNATLANPTNVVAGGIYHIIVEQDGTGGRTLTFGTNFKIAGSSLISPEINAKTVISLVCVTSSVILSTLIGGFYA